MLCSIPITPSSFISLYFPWINPQFSIINTILFWNYFGVLIAST
ncbi:hypothetical protein D082_06800 [Synechocystis sp. PCC 6714]|nr:hypothetical protein D082_06800 [Synechocystis sp. PCC 6714]